MTPRFADHTDVVVVRNVFADFLPTRLALVFDYVRHLSQPLLYPYCYTIIKLWVVDPRSCVQRYKWLEIVEGSKHGTPWRKAGAGDSDRAGATAMIAKTSNGNQSTDPRDAYIMIGVDEEGAHHIYRTRDETVHVIRDGKRTYRQELHGRSVNQWINYVRGKRGWKYRDLFVDLGDFANSRIN